MPIPSPTVSDDEDAHPRSGATLDRLPAWALVVGGFGCGLVGLTCCGGFAYLVGAVVIGGLAMGP